MQINNINKEQIKNKKFKSFKRFASTTLAAIGLGLCLTGCIDFVDKETTYREYVDFEIIESDELYKKHDEYRIINVKKDNGENQYYFTNKESLAWFKIHNQSITDWQDIYEKYYFKGYNENISYVYLDMDSKDVISVRYDKALPTLRSIRYEEGDYFKINEIISDEPAYDYVVSYFGEQESYTKEDIVNTVSSLNVKNNQNENYKMKNY